jgi:MoxR-like ATPase
MRTMRALASELTSFITGSIRDRTAVDPGQRVQVELIGPPDGALELVYQGFTAAGDTFAVPGGPDAVHALFVEGPDADPTDPPEWLSQRCNWDYAVAIRNSVDASVTLVKRAAWDGRQESLANTSESFGSPGFAGRAALALREEPWPFLVARAQARTGMANPVAVEWALRKVIQESVAVGAPLSDEPWLVVDALLALRPPTTFEAAVGVPMVDAMNATGTTALESAYKVLEALARFCAENGFTAAEEQLADAGDSLVVDGQLHADPRPALAAMFRHLLARCGSAAAFRQSPLRGFRIVDGDTWHDELTADAIRRLLERSGAADPPPVGRLEIRCTNALNPSDRAKDEPLVVRDAVELQSLVDVPPLPTVEFERRVTRGFTPLATVDGMPAGTTRDPTPPDHAKPLTYQVTAAQHRAASVRIVSLGTFRAQGHVRVRGALSNPAPGGRDRMQQVIRVAGTGEHDLVVYGAAGVTGAWLTTPDGSRTPLTWHPATGSASMSLLVDQNEEYAIELVDPAGETITEWTISLQVDDPVGVAPRSRFEALVRAHQASAGGARPARPRPVMAPASPARDLERALLVEPGSWRGITGCWASDARPSTAVDWPTATVGNIPVPLDPRPPRDVSAPPPSYLAAREAVREFLLDQGENGRPVPAVDYSPDAVQFLAAAYLAEFHAWQQAAPDNAAWSDCVAVYGTERNTHAGTDVAGPEPVALLLSPLHPVRFAWQAHAQRLMTDALEDPCPGAAMIDPHACPALYALPLGQGGRTEWRAFVGGDSADPYWSLAWNAEYMADPARVHAVAITLGLLGFAAATLTPGFTPAQAKRSLDEVARVFPTRARLRVGIAGQGGGGQGPVMGTVDWSRAHFERPVGEPPRALPATLEVRDLRDAPAGPTAAELALLHQETGEAVSWYTAPPPPGSGGMDLVVLDQLAGQDPRLRPDDNSAHLRAALAPGALMRLAPRRDFDDAHLIEEPRVATGPSAGPGLDAALVRAVSTVEEAAARATGLGILRFRPNQQALASRLGEASFVAVSSTQVDPACFVRGAHGAGGYLWDYELPGGPSGGGRAGYYLVAVPPPSMHAAVAAAARVLAGAEVPAAPLLDEVSRRGIPVLRRVTRGGNLARGELGVLVVARWLQDAFRRGGGPVRLPVLADECVHLLLPVDSYWEMLLGFGKALWSAQRAEAEAEAASGGDAYGEGPAGADEDGDAILADAGHGAMAEEDQTADVVGRLSAQHSDVLVFSLHVPLSGAGPVSVYVTPLEVKLRNHEITTEELTAALRQASNLGTVLRRLWEPGRARNALWTACGNAFLAQALDQLFRVYADVRVHGTDPDTWARVHGRVLQDVLAGDARVEVNVEGVVVASDTSPHSYTLRLGGGTGPDNAAVIGRPDTVRLLVGDGGVDPLLAGPARTMGLSIGPCLAGNGGGAPRETEGPAPVPAAGNAYTPTDTGDVPSPPASAGASAASVKDAGESADAVETGAREAVEVTRLGDSPVPAVVGGEGAPGVPGAHGESAEPTAPASVVPDEVRERARAAFDGFVGNENAIYRIKNDLMAAALADPPHLSKNYLLSGEPSTGKTEIARRMATALDLPFVKLEGRGLTPARLFTLIAAELRDRGVRAEQVGRMSGRPLLRYPPLVIFVDEVHLVPRPVQESFLTALEPNDRTMDAGAHVARMDQTTFIFATTRTSDVDNAFRTRCTPVQLRAYALDEVAEIVRRRTAGENWPTEVYLKIAELGRMVPRIALELASELRTEILVTEHPGRGVPEHLDRVRRAREVDERGLTALDWQYLETLERWGPLGEQNITTRLGTVDRDRIVEEVEPLLLRLGFITKGLRGREITPEGRRYIRGAVRPG